MRIRGHFPITLFLATLILATSSTPWDALAQSSVPQKTLKILNRSQLPEHVDLSCQIPPFERAARIWQVRTRKDALTAEISRLNELHLRTVERQQDFEQAYLVSNGFLMISAVAGIASGAGVAAESFFGASSLQITAEGVSFVPRTLTGLGKGQALMTPGFSAGGLRIAPQVLSQNGVRTFLTTRIAMIMMDAYHLIFGDESAQEIQQSLQELALRFKQSGSNRDYLSPQVIAYLSSPEPQASRTRPPELDQKNINDSLARLTAFHDEFSRRIGLEPDSFTQHLTEFMMHREGEQAALDAAVLELRIELLKMKRTYWSDIERILMSDAAACG